MPADIEFSELERARYGRHFTLPQVGVAGQRQLKRARVLIIGAGGLGSPAALYLAGAGVGTLGLVDFDVVDATNLHRQLLHGTRDVGRSKLESARDRLHDVNPHVTLELHETRLSSANALDIMRAYDVILDGTDNFATRYLVNDACVLLGKPNVYGSIFRFEGQASLFCTPDAPCYRCLYPEPPPPGSVPSCAEGGVLGVLPGLVGTIQATEAIKLCLGIGSTLAGRLLLIDALGMEFRTVRINRDPACPMCGTRTIHELIDYDAFCGTPAPRVVQDTTFASLTPAEVAAKRARGDDFDLLDVREAVEWDTGHVDGARTGAAGHAVRRVARARSIAGGGGDVSQRRPQCARRAAADRRGLHARGEHVGRHAALARRGWVGGLSGARGDA
jgi:sulfur-carrier protein adenylyltransferase/sulfurtransferase